MSEAARTATGSRTAAYLVCGFLLGVPVWLVGLLLGGMQGAFAALVVLWATGVVWLLKKRQDDPGWDAGPPS